MTLSGILLGGFAALAIVFDPTTMIGRAQAETRSIQDWEITCRDGNCAAHYNTQGLQIVVAVPAEGTSRRIVLRLHPNATVGEPVGIRLNGGWYAGLAVSSCGEQACQAAVNLEANAEVEQAFKRARDGVVAYQAGSMIVIAPISLVGFTGALAEMKD